MLIFDINNIIISSDNSSTNVSCRSLSPAEKYKIRLVGMVEGCDLNGDLDLITGKVFLFSYYNSVDKISAWKILKLIENI